MHLLNKHNPHRIYFGFETWIYIAVSLLLGFRVSWIDHSVFPGWFSPVDNESLISILTAIASGMITLSGLVFSLFFVLIQFGTATYSPRLSRMFAHSFILRHSLGIFTGTFLYSLMAMRTIGFENRRTSGIVVWIAFVWLILSVAILAGMVNIFITMAITNTLRSLSINGRNSIRRIYSSTTRHNIDIRVSAEKFHDNELSTQRVFYSGSFGYIVGYRIEHLLRIAQKTDTVLYLPHYIGDVIKSGSELVMVQGGKTLLQESSLLDAIQIEIGPGFRNDPKFILRLLVDTALRSLSPAVNDPTTAVQVLDHIEYLLFLLGNMNLDIGSVTDTNGVLRVVFKTPDWKDYLQLALIEIMHYGSRSIQVQRRLKALLFDLKKAVRPDRVEALDNIIIWQVQLIQQSFDYEPFRQMASVPDREGLGTGSF